MKAKRACWIVAATVAVGVAIAAVAAVDYNMSQAEMARHERERIGPLYRVPAAPHAPARSR